MANKITGLYNEAVKKSLPPASAATTVAAPHAQIAARPADSELTEPGLLAASKPTASKPVRWHGKLFTPFSFHPEAR